MYRTILIIWTFNYPQLFSKQVYVPLCLLITLKLSLITWNPDYLNVFIGSNDFQIISIISYMQIRHLEFGIILCGISRSFS